MRFSKRGAEDLADHRAAGRQVDAAPEAFGAFDELLVVPVEDVALGRAVGDGSADPFLLAAAA